MAPSTAVQNSKPSARTGRLTTALPAHSTPLHPKSNGFAEAMVKIVKGAMQKAKHSGSDPYLALLDLRATPIDAQLPSPAELLYQCRLRMTLPCRLKNTDPSAQDTQDCLDQKCDNQKRGNDQHAKALAPLYAGQQIAWYNTHCGIWFPATVKRVPD